MKALIVDDERHVIEAIKMLVPWSDLGISEVHTATSIEEAKDVLRKNIPEIAFIDIIMGEEYGMELMEYILQQKYPTKVITISGHSDFEFVRQMLLYGSVDYLLKPLDRGMLAAAAKKAVAEYSSDKQEKTLQHDLKQQVNYLSREHQRTLLLRMFTPDSLNESYITLCNINPVISDLKSCVVLYCDLNFYKRENPAFSSAFSTTFYDIRRCLEYNIMGTALLRQRIPNEVLIVIYDKHEEALELLRAALNNLHIMYGLYFGCSEVEDFPENIMKAYEHSKAAFLDVDVTVKPTVLSKWKNPSGAAHVTFDKQKETQIFSALLTSDKDAINKTVIEWTDSILPETDFSLRTVSKIFNYFWNLYEEWTNYFSQRYEGFAHKVPNPQQVIPMLFDQEHRFLPEEMVILFSDNLCRLGSELHRVNRSDDVSQKVADYLEINYNQPFNQKECAMMFHINKDYLCRKFKGRFGVGMVTYLNEVRIRHAKELLVVTSMSVSDIALSVGYNNEKYFSKIFKNITSMTPSEYRINHQND